MKAIQTNTCTNLKLLDISSNNLFDNVAVVIGECLTCNTTLKVLDISKNYITDRGIKILANAIQANATLLKLFLCSNRISDGGVVAIGKCLTINNTLQELSLSWNNNTTKEGITKFAEGIAVNTSLHILDLSSDYVNDPVDSVMTLLTAMDHNHTMMRLVLPKGNINETMIKIKLDKINEERIKKGIETLKLDSKAI